MMENAVSFAPLDRLQGAVTRLFLGHHLDVHRLLAPTSESETVIETGPTEETPPSTLFQSSGPVRPGVLIKG